MTKIKKTKDIHAKREAEKYEQPIVSREFIIDYLNECESLRNLKQIAQDLNITTDQDLEALRRRLRAMERDGQLLSNRRGAYGVAARMDLIKGHIMGHPDGFGFVIPEDGESDLFLSERQMRSVLHGDHVLVNVVGVDRRGRREGSIVEVLERKNQQIIGKFYLDRGIGTITASNRRISQDIIVPQDEQMDAKDGQIVVAEIIEQPSRRSQPKGRIIQILGDHMAPGMEIEVAARSHDLPHIWSEAVEAEIAGLADEVPASAIGNRIDIRELPLVTIDGSDSRDFDDAVYCEKHGKGWRLLVAIADVSSYVIPGTALDAEAFERGNSVYFPKQVIPMLPEVLSNGLCSINPDVDRLCLVAEMFLTASGKVKESQFFEGVMRSHARLTYDKVAAMVVDHDAALREEYQELVSGIDELYHLYQAMRVARNKRGAIDFDRTETQIVFDDQRKIEKIVPLVRNDAHKMIEEFMVAANIAAAEFLDSYEMPFVYRVHPEPKTEKLADLRDFLAEMGLKIGGGAEPKAGDYARLISSIGGRVDRHLIETVLLRSLSQARYHPDNVGHFGLALDHYTHFTSPIRRYTDLLVHRGIRHVIAGKKANSFHHSHSEMEHFGGHCSMTERRADEATREATDWLKCEYMQSKVGEVFDGIITSVTSFGLFVELSDIYIEGLVHVTALGNDYYHFDPAKHRMVGENSGVIYRLSDPIRIQVVRVDLDEKKIDFVLESTGSDKKPAKKGATKKKSAQKKSNQKRSAQKKTAKKPANESADKTPSDTKKPIRKRRRTGATKGKAASSDNAANAKSTDGNKPKRKSPVAKRRSAKPQGGTD